MGAWECGWVPGRVGECLGVWVVPGRVGECLGGWVHKGVSEGVIKWVAWFGGLGVCSLVSKRYVHWFFSIHFSLCIFLHGIFSVGFGGRPKDMVVVSACLQGSSLEMDCLLGAHWDLSLLEV